MHDYEIQHQDKERLFFVPLEDGQRAFIKYRLSGSESAEAQVDFFSTFVPDGYRGTGLAAKLVDYAFAWADTQNLHINSSCWYAAKKLDRRSRA